MKISKRLRILIIVVGVVAVCVAAWLAYDSGKYIVALKGSAPYSPGSYAGDESFTYASADDSCMRRMRQFFKLDSIAGSGNEVSQMKNIMVWLHNNIRHDGWNGFPKGVDHNAIDLYKACKAQNRGLNCRGLAIVLSELYMSMGWPSRFVTCQSVKYDVDPDCHVICMVWSHNLGKWLWMDPTFAAYVMDEDGQLLGIREVRQRLIDGDPLSINADANWNNEDDETTLQYLYIYMAKNLYYISAHLHNGFNIESSDAPNEQYTLTPAGANIGYGVNVSDDDWFWQGAE